MCRLFGECVEHVNVYLCLKDFFYIFRCESIPITDLFPYSHTSSLQSYIRHINQSWKSVCAVLVAILSWTLDSVLIFHIVKIMAKWPYYAIRSKPKSIRKTAIFPKNNNRTIKYNVPPSSLSTEKANFYLQYLVVIQTNWPV